MKDILLYLGLPGEDLLLRDIGELARKKINDELELIPDGCNLKLDFNGIKSVDVSFADEGIVKLQKEVISKKYSNRRIMLINIQKSVEENIEGAIFRREEKYGERIPILIKRNNKVEILGKIEKSLKEIFERIIELGALSARELVEELDIEINNASNKLKKLYDYGLVYRDEIINEEGRQHIYRVPE